MRDDNNPAEKSKKKYGFVERILLLLPREYPKVCVNLQTDVR